MPAPARLPDPKLLAWAEARLRSRPGPATGAAPCGPIARAVPCGHAQGPNAVWRLELANGASCYLKRSSQARSFEQETRAYREWLAPLPPPQAAGADAALPQLLAADPSARALLLTGLRPDPEARPPYAPALHHAAGRFLRRLHASGPAAADAIPLATAIAARGESWIERLAAQLTPSEREGARALIDAGRAFRAEQRVRCHRDYQPRNWLDLGADLATPRLGVIDFEHARGDHWLSDVVRLSSGAWQARDDLASAFWSGYGGPRPARYAAEPSAPARRLERQLIALETVHAVATLAWAQQHADPTFEAEGRSLLERLLA